MRLDALIEKLLEIQEDLEARHNQGPDDGQDFDPSSVEVRLMHQPRYPLEYKIENVVTSHQITEIEDYERDADGRAREIGEGEEASIVYLTEGYQVGYGRRAAWEV